MKKKAIGFIDGNNFYHNAKKQNILFSKVDFSKIMKFICEERNLEYTGFYYYNSVPKLDEDKEAYYNQMAYFDKVRKMDNNLGVITKKLRYKSAKDTLNDYSKQQQKIEESKLCEKCKKNMQQPCFDCIIKKRKREKGVDVAIAIDVVQNALDDKYDICILFSGDSDFVPALELIIKRGKEAISSFIRCKGYSWELLQKMDCIPINNTEFENFIIKQ
ncbi:NYN domain-containing protein [Candidatus Micrarchaeota archaeon]|nr:NYN domain-containing protein [Candidatus Micrarchaeota archaeon]